MLQHHELRELPSANWRTDLHPRRHPRPTTPLPAGARFIRGFTRIGAVVAVLVGYSGVALSIFIAIDRHNSALNGHQSAQCIAHLARSGYTFKQKEYSTALEYSVGGCRGWYSYEPIKEVIAIADSPVPTFLTSEGAPVLGWRFVITGLLAVAAYVAFWAIGWLCAGFTRDACEAREKFDLDQNILP